ncbi:MAG: FtsX-like permease family protein, partial [Candidatus Bathyarchaeia archaeon]
MLSYAVKRVLRSLGLFAALLLGVALASSFFAGINIGADTTAKASLLQQLNSVLVDITVSSGSTISSEDWERTADDIRQVDGVIGAEVISRAYTVGYFSNQNYTLMVTAISNASKVYNGLNVTKGVDALGVNETYVWLGSKAAGKIMLGDTIILNLTYSSWRGLPEKEQFLVLPLKVAGFVELDDKAYSIATGEWGPPVIILRYAQTAGIYGDLLLIVSWEKTFAKVLDSLSQDSQSYNLPFSTQILVYIDRDSLINPWDIPSSMEAVERVTIQVNERIAKYSGMYVSNNIEATLITYQFTSMGMRLAFILVALPVFFVAWYVGTTVSDVSYNLRRREIGLLLTKGFSNSQLFRLFLTESMVIGIIGGLVGVGLGFLLSPFFVTASERLEGVTPVLNIEVIIITIVFSLAITLLSTFRPSRKAAKLPVVEALREYTYIEEVKPYKQRLPWVAFTLGLYKIAMFLLGINLVQVFTGRPLPFTNIFLIILLAIWLSIDYILTYIGPLLFLWGFTKIFISGSLKFQEFVARAVKFLGDLGTLATKNVQRNPAKAASVAFLVALIVGYSFQTIGVVASEQDYAVRRIKADVGADISIILDPATNTTKIMSTIKSMTEVASATIQYYISGSSSIGSMQIIVVDPDAWLSTAYYEEEWFSGSTAVTAFQLMKSNNQTIVLERSVASRLNKKVGDTIMVAFDSLTLWLKIVGFFGPEVTQEYRGWAFWSYIPITLYESLDLGWQPSATILVKLKAGVDGKFVASKVRNFEGVNYVRSVAEELETYQVDLTIVGRLNIQRLGVVFS